MYIPWNVHEPSPGKFDFSHGLDVVSFIKKAQEQNLLVIVRPSPYICAGNHLPPPQPHLVKVSTTFSTSKFKRYQSLTVPYRTFTEFEFGGLPAWLLAKPGLKQVRSSDPSYLESVDKFFDVLMPMLAPLQYSQGK